MNQKFLNLITSLIFLITATNCKNTAFDPRYREKWMKENVKFLKHPNYQGINRKDPKDITRQGDYWNSLEAGCILERMGFWERRVTKDQFGYTIDRGWGRDQTWSELNTNWVTGTGVSLDSSSNQYLHQCSKDSIIVTKDSSGKVTSVRNGEKKCLPEDSSAAVAQRITEGKTKSTFIYIGPWKYVSKIGKEIRFVATQGVVYGGIHSFYESKTPENEKIPEMPEIKLARSPEVNLDYCKVLWVKTYGYNGVIDIQLNYPIGIFTGKIMKGSGKIIQADE